MIWPWQIYCISPTCAALALFLSFAPIPTFARVAHLRLRRGWSAQGLHVSSAKHCHGRLCCCAACLRRGAGLLLASSAGPVRAAEPLLSSGPTGQGSPLLWACEPEASRLASPAGRPVRAGARLCGRPAGQPTDISS